MSRLCLFRTSPLRLMVLLCMALAMIVGLVLPSTAQEGHSPWARDGATPAAEQVLDDWIAAAIRPELQQTIAGIMPANLPVYDINVTL